MLQKEYADNAISYTINVNPRKVKVKDIEAALRVHLPHLKGTTLMPEASREQMPLERITKEEYEKAVLRGQAMVSDAERECQNGACPIK
jgi:ribonucleoside-triphosphate reductase